MMKFVRKYISPIVVLVIVLLSLSIYMFMYPGPEGWGFLGAIYNIFIFILPLLLINAIINSFIKNKNVWWVMQIFITLCACFFLLYLIRR